MEFSGIKYEVLYSNQINKKNKSWKDGFMTYFPNGSKAYLYDEENKKIDSYYGIGVEIALEEEIKFDKYVVLPQSIIQNTFNSNQSNEKNIQNEKIVNDIPYNNKSSSSSNNNNNNNNNKIPILNKIIKKKENNKIPSNSRSISQLLSLFPNSQIPTPKPLSQNINNTNKNYNNTNLPSLNNDNTMNTNNDDDERFNSFNNNNNNNSNLNSKEIQIENSRQLQFNNNSIENNYNTKKFNNQNINKDDAMEYSNINVLSRKDIKLTSENHQNNKYNIMYNYSDKHSNNDNNNRNNHINSFNNNSISNNNSNIVSASNNSITSYNNQKNKSTLSNNDKYNKKQSENDLNKSELYFPSSEECLEINNNNLIRNAIIPVNFPNVHEYQEAFRKAIIENIQIELSKLAIKFRSLPLLNESSYRSNGINFYSDCILTRFQPVFLKFKKKNNNCNYLLTIAKKEKSSAYSKDDIWIISINKNFEKNTTFLAKSVFYGPNGNSAVEVEPISKTDIEVSKYLTLSKKPIFHVCAIRTININTEEIILSNLRTNLTKSSVLPYLLNYSNTMKKKNDKSRFNSPSMVSLINEKKIPELDDFLNDIVIQYKLNEDQETVLRTFVESLKTSSKSPITLVHGVFGAGKSLLISIIIFFLYRSYISGFINLKTNFKILISSMTNVAVDRILLYLMEKFDFKNFVRVGSLKKIARPLLPYAAQISKGNEDIEELNSLLKCDDLSPKEVKYIQETIKKFKKNENRNNIHQSFLIATTCIASSFEILDNTKVPIVILDECSQFIEPLSLMPICRFQSEKLLLVGDPKQLSPTITTNSAYDKDPVNKGLDRTLFERLALCQCHPILLRTQYRCHPTISNISNCLFYENKLINGRKSELPEELCEKFPILCFVDINSMGKSQFSSFINPSEADFIVKSIEKLVENGINGEDIGVISLYKGQADLIKNRLGSNPIDKIKMIQVSTVDAFQGAEKSIIFLSIVKSNSSEFIDSDRRVNVAITRAKNHLVLVGNKTNLIKFSVIWKNIITEHCQHAENGILKPNDFYTLINV